MQRAQVPSRPAGKSLRARQKQANYTAHRARPHRRSTARHAILSAKFRPVMGRNIDFVERTKYINFVLQIYISSIW